MTEQYDDLPRQGTELPPQTGTGPVGNLGEIQMASDVAISPYDAVDTTAEQTRLGPDLPIAPPTGWGKDTPEMGEALPVTGDLNQEEDIPKVSSNAELVVVRNITDPDGVQVPKTPQAEAPTDSTPGQDLAVLRPADLIRMLASLNDAPVQQSEGPTNAPEATPIVSEASLGALVLRPAVPLPERTEPPQSADGPPLDPPETPPGGMSSPEDEPERTTDTAVAIRTSDIVRLLASVDKTAPPQVNEATPTDDTQDSADTLELVGTRAPESSAVELASPQKAVASTENTSETNDGPTDTASAEKTAAQSEIPQSTTEQVAPPAETPQPATAETAEKPAEQVTPPQETPRAAAEEPTETPPASSESASEQAKEKPQEEVFEPDDVLNEEEFQAYQQQRSEQPGQEQPDWSKASPEDILNLIFATAAKMAENMANGQGARGQYTNPDTTPPPPHAPGVPLDTMSAAERAADEAVRQTVAALSDPSYVRNGSSWTYGEKVTMGTVFKTILMVLGIGPGIATAAALTQHFEIQDVHERRGPFGRVYDVKVSNGRTSRYVKIHASNTQELQEKIASNPMTRLRIGWALN